MTNSLAVSPTTLGEYEALLAGKGISKVYFDIIEITGKDRVKFLHNFCTANIKEMVPSQGKEAFALNVKGKTLAFGYVLINEQSIYFVSAAGLAETLIAHFDKYVITEDVQLSDRSSDFDCWSCSSIALEKLRSGDNSGKIDDSTQPYLSHVEMSRNSTSCQVVHSSLTSASDRLMIIPVGSRSMVEKWFDEVNLTVVGPDAFEMARIENGTPFFGRDVSENNLPQEVGRNETAISFTKGCYLGQETVARIDALGHVNKFLVRLKFSEQTIPEFGTELTSEGKVVGQTCSACYSPRLQAPIAFAYLKRGLEVPGTRLDSQVGEATVLDGQQIG